MFLQIVIKLLRAIVNLFNKFIDQPIGWFFDFCNDIVKNIPIINQIVFCLEGAISVVFVILFCPIYITSEIFHFIDSESRYYNTRIEVHRSQIRFQLIELKNKFPILDYKHDWVTDGF